MIMDEVLGKSSFQASDYLEYLKRVAPLLSLTNDISLKEKSLPGKILNSKSSSII
jgi:hypothetical protein